MPRMFFKAVVYAVLLFILETWVMTPRMGRSLGEFQHRVDRCIIFRKTKRQADGSWEYLPMETTMEDAGLEDMVEYVLKRKNRVAK